MRGFFRFHLGTLVVLSFVCGGLIWANVAASMPRPTAAAPSSTPGKGMMSSIEFDGSNLIITCMGPFVQIKSHRIYGWPMICYDANRPILWDFSQPFQEIDELSVASKGGVRVSEWIWSSVLVDVLANLGIARLVVVLFEWWMRRRGAKKAPSRISKADSCDHLDGVD